MTQEELRVKLRDKFDAAPYKERTAFVWTSQLGTCNKTRYGSFKIVKEADLIGREYVLEYWDYCVSIFYTDVRHDPKTRKNIPWTSGKS